MRVLICALALWATTSAAQTPGFLFGSEAIVDTQTRPALRKEDITKVDRELILRLNENGCGNIAIRLQQEVNIYGIHSPQVKTLLRFIENRQCLR